MENFKFELEFEEKLMMKTLNQAFNKISPSSTLGEHVESQKMNEEVGNFLTEQGLLGMLEPLQSGNDMNLGLSSILARETGRRLLNFPVIEHVLGVFLMKQFEETSEIEPFELGDKLVTIGWNSNISIHRSANELRITGKIDAIPFATEADMVLVPVKGQSEDDEGYVLSIDAKHFNNQFKKLETHDLTYTLYELVINDLIIDQSTIKKTELNLKLFYDVSDLIIASELLGIAEEVLSMTLDYVTERKQFGVEIGKFQAVKHMLADMHLLCESSKVAIEFGAWAIENNGEDKDIVSPIAKAYSSDAARRIVQEAIQLHGGIGFAWEHDLHFYLKRTYRLANMSGTPYEEREEIASYLLGVSD